MAMRSFQRAIRFTESEWEAVIAAVEKAGITPGTFARKAAARTAADDLYLYGGGLTSELTELIKRTFRGVHLLAYLKREELDRSGGGEDFRRAAEAALGARAGMLGPNEPGRES